MTPSSSIAWPRFVELVRLHERFVLTTHMRPDCDALGSELGMADILLSLGKQVRIVNGDSVPPHLRFIDPGNRILQLGKDVSPADLAADHVLLILDTSAWGQLGPVADVLRHWHGVKMVLDHHASQDDLGAEMFKNVHAEATGRLVCEAGEQLGAPLGEQTAFPLLAAITTDTGWFRFSSTTGETLRVAARLLDAGARPEVLYRQLYEQDSLARLHLFGRVLARATAEADGRLIYITVLAQDFAETGAHSSDTEDLINFTLKVRGTEVAIIFIEVGAETFKVSFRSRSTVDVSKLAEGFGGGGHRQAAGATVHGTLADVQGRVLAAVRGSLK